MPPNPSIKSAASPRTQHPRTIPVAAFMRDNVDATSKHVRGAGS